MKGKPQTFLDALCLFVRDHPEVMALTPARTRAAVKAVLKMQAGTRDDPMGLATGNIRRKI